MRYVHTFLFLRSMKILSVFSILCSACIISSCKYSSPKDNNMPVTDSKAGTIIAADTIPITEDKLNNSTFSVTVLATDSVGTYDVEASWGNNFAQSTIKMPTGGEHYKPILRKSSNDYTYTLGFHFDTDTIFHEYYQVSAQRGQIAMKYTRAYIMETK